MIEDLIERIVTAQREMLKHEIEANTVTINGNRYGMLIQQWEQYYIAPTIFGMAVNTDYSMPDDIDFIVQYIKPHRHTNADRIRAMTDEELAELLGKQEYKKPTFDGWLPLCSHVMGPRKCHKNGCRKCWIDWLKQEDGE